MKDEIVLYRPDELAEHIEVRLEDDTVWLSQQQMATLFNQTKQNISLHVNNCFKEGELEKEATVKESLTVQKEGNIELQINTQLIPNQDVFFDGQIFDAYELASFVEIRSVQGSLKELI